MPMLPQGPLNESLRAYYRQDRAEVYESRYPTKKKEEIKTGGKRVEEGGRKRRARLMQLRDG